MLLGTMAIETSRGTSAKRGRNSAEFKPEQSAAIPRAVDGMHIRVVYLGTEAKYTLKPYGRRDGIFTWQLGEPDLHRLMPNPFQVRARFAAVRTREQALEFLNSTGIFLPAGISRFTWGHFVRWQHLVRLIGEHEQLAKAMRNRQLKGKKTEVLKAIGGDYPSTYFLRADERLKLISAAHESASETEFVRSHWNELKAGVEASEKLALDQLWALCKWFRSPPGLVNPRTDSGVSIGIAPITVNEELTQALSRGGAMLEFLLPRDQLRKEMLVQTRFTMEAVAGTIYADWLGQVTRKVCPECRELFDIGPNQLNRTYCVPQGKCSNTAAKRRQRAHAKGGLVLL